MMEFKEKVPVGSTFSDAFLFAEAGFVRASMSVDRRMRNDFDYGSGHSAHRLLVDARESSYIGMTL